MNTVQKSDEMIIDAEDVSPLPASVNDSDLGINVNSGLEIPPAHHERNVLYLRHLFLPFIFLTVTLLGGLRIASQDSAFIFHRPALVCLIFASILLVLFARSRVIELDGWFAESFPTLKNVANGF